MARMRGKADPLKSLEFALPGSAQCNVLFTLAAWSWAHRIGGNLHRTHQPLVLRLANRHRTVCNLFWVQCVGERAHARVCIFTFPGPMAKKGNLPLAAVSAVGRTLHTSLNCFQVMVHPQACRQGLGPGNSEVPGKPFPWCSLVAASRICSKFKAQMPGEATGIQSLLPVEGPELVAGTETGLFVECGGLPGSSGRAGQELEGFCEPQH